MAKRLQNKVCVVTGTSGSIGRAAALRFAEEGAMVELHGAAQLDLVGAVGGLGGQAFFVDGDHRRSRGLGGRGLLGQFELAFEDGQGRGQGGDGVGICRRRCRGFAEAGLEAL